MDIEECESKGLVKRVRADINKIEALLKSAGRKQEASDALPDRFYEAKLTLLYDALRILLESLALRKGFKIYNHECYTSFLKEILKESALGDKFDNFRKIRNAINYYAKELAKDEAEEIMKQMKKFISELKARSK